MTDDLHNRLERKVNDMEKIIKLHPAICAVGRNYQIMIVTECDALVSVRVGEKTYFSQSNGIKKSLAGVHCIIVDMETLDKEKSYVLVLQKIIERSPYFPTSEPPVEIKYTFRPIEKTSGINIYHLADVHGEYERAINAAKYAGGDYDLLILNGDIADSTETFEDLILCYKIASAVTGGEYPCVISRGNHDMRGVGAENLSDVMPTLNGKTYYTFKIGCIWGMVVDAGEDKDDSREEYGGTICCHDFRVAQEKMIENVIEHRHEEYLASDVTYRIVISHIPFTFRDRPPFDIERELYKKWGQLVQNNIKPSFMLCGHTHRATVSHYKTGGDKEQGFPIVVGAETRLSETNDAIVLFAGAKITLDNKVANVTVNTGSETIFEQCVELM